MIHREVDKIGTVRKAKIQYGDIIQRSEYTDGVLRDNNRAGNRLSNEMKMYDRAQKVLLKQMNKEAATLRNKIGTTSTTPSASTPRLTKLSTSEIKNNPFMVYGTRSQKFDPKTTSSRSSYPTSEKEKYSTSNPRSGLDTVGGTSARNATKSSAIDRQKTESRRSQSSSMQSKHKGLSFKRDLTREDDSGIQTGSSMSEYRFSGKTSGSAMSEYRGGDKSSLSTVMTENRSRLNMNQPSSPKDGGISFIEILKEAEERRAKQESQKKELNERRMKEDSLLVPEEQPPRRPRTPDPTKHDSERLSNNSDEK